STRRQSLEPRSGTRGTSSRHQSVLPLFAVAPPALPHRGDADTPSRIPRLEEYLVSAARRMTHRYRAADCNRSTPCPEPARGARTEVASLSACVDATPAWAPVWHVEFDVWRRRCQLPIGLPETPETRLAVIASSIQS